MSQLGFTYGETDDGAYWLRAPDGRFKRVARELMVHLLQLAQQHDSPGSGDPRVRAAVRTLREQGFVREGEPVQHRVVTSEMRLHWRVMLFGAGLIGLGVAAWASLDRVTWVTDPWVHLWVVPMFALLAALHELGHWAAARPYFEARITFGLLNGVFPALVTHTNEAWTCPRKVRIWISLAGPSVDVVAGLAFAWASWALWPDSSLLASLVVVQLLRVLFVLNPLLEGDGYWALCDIFGLTNLRTRGLADLRAARMTWPALYAVGSGAFVTLALAWSVFVLVRILGAAQG